MTDIDTKLLFSGQWPEPKHPDVLSIQLLTVADVPEQVFSTLVFKSTAVGHLTSLEAILKAVHEHIHLQNLHRKPVSLGRINRYFGRVSRKMGYSSRTVCEHLIDRGLVTVLSRNGKTGMISTAIWQEIPDMLELLGVARKSAEYHEHLDAWSLATV
jgi:hypothetical protein